jgi:hypothetical protein
VELLDSFGEHYEKLPLVERLGVEFAIGYALGTAEVKGILALPKAAEASLAGDKFFAGVPQVLAKLSSLEGILEARHKAATAHEVTEAVGELAGLEDPDHYPIMGAVIRGQFTTNQYALADSNHKVIVAGTTLSLGIATTDFPTISLAISRNAYQATPSSGSVFGTTYSGPLPWQGSTSIIATSNPTWGANPPGVLSDAETTRPGGYLSGLAAVEDVIEDTTGTLNLSDIVADGGMWSSPSDYNNALLDSPDPPTCTKYSTAPAHTICWTFSDQRP